MIMKDKNKTKKLLVMLSLIIVAVLLLFIKLFFTPKNKLILLNVNPKNNQENISTTPVINFSFNQEINNQGWTVQTTPEVSFSLETYQKTLTLKTERPLELNTGYLIEITNKNYNGFFYRLGFKTIGEDQTPSPTPNPEKTRKHYENLAKETYKDMPLFDYMPCREKNFSMDYISPLTLLVTLKKDTPEARREVLEWIEEKGIDPSTHQINWKVQR